jgi:hypothetical protein
MGQAKEVNKKQHMVEEVITLEAVGIGELGQQLQVGENESSVVLELLLREAIRQFVDVDMLVDVKTEDDTATVSLTLKTDHLVEAVQRAFEMAADSVHMSHDHVMVKALARHYGTESDQA